jgi:hypothetical protein
LAGEQTSRQEEEQMINHDVLSIGITNIIAILATIGIMIPLALGKIGMNAAYGIRIKKAFESEDMWQTINRYGGKRFIIWSAVALVEAALSLFAPMPAVDPQRILVTLLLILVPPFTMVVFPIFEIFRFSKRLTSK